MLYNTSSRRESRDLSTIMTTIIIILIIVAIIYFATKSKKQNDNATTAAPATGSDDAFDDLIAETIGSSRALQTDENAAPVDKALLDQKVTELTQVMMPNKHGDFNDMKKVGKTLAKMNEEISKTYAKGTPEYDTFFNALYAMTLFRILHSGNEKLKAVTQYTIVEWDQCLDNGVSKSFKKGVSEDLLVSKAELLMAIAEKCWFDNIKLTLFRKDMEKYNLPSSTPQANA